MPQLAPIMWISLFSFLWIILVSWMIFSWFYSKKSFKGENLKIGPEAKLNIWKW